MQGRAYPLTQPTSPTWLGLSGSGPLSAQLSTLPQPASIVSVGAHSPCVFATSSLFLPVTSSTQVSPGTAQTSLAGKGAIDLALSQEPCGFSMSYTIFGLLSSYMLGYCWLLALFLSRSAKCFTCVQGEVESAPTYLATILKKIV